MVLREKIVILDFGSQYTQLIARRIRELGTYSEIFPFWTEPENFGEGVIGIILSGGPSSVYDQNRLLPSKKIFEMNIPVLGICYGLQVISLLFGGRIVGNEKGEYGYHKINIIEVSKLLKGVKDGSTVWMSHG
ncbi:MAG: gamma-glutamyl-gamma-aminobutyrate hydrolase family protein, partial [Candidatus Hydrothermia bacterium]